MHKAHKNRRLITEEFKIRQKNCTTMTIMVLSSAIKPTRRLEEDPITEWWENSRISSKWKWRL